MQTVPSMKIEASASNPGIELGGEGDRRPARSAIVASAEARGDRSERVEVGEAALDDDRRDRVAERRDEDQHRAEQLGGLAGDVQAQQRDDAAEADREARARAAA